MNYLSVEGLTKSFGDRVLFKDLTFGIDQGQKVAIVAKNGSGKTTLLKCLLDKEQYDEGNVVYRNDIRVSYMEQAEDLDSSNTIFEEIFSHDIPELKAIADYNKAIRKNDQDLMQHAYEQVSNLNAWDTEVKVNQVLSKLKLDNIDSQIGKLSGGQKKRVALAKVLITEADFLILDEPTNHLDLDMIEWLEDFLSRSLSTLLMVTHDRYFLEVVCDTIFELEDLTLYKYKGNFSYFLEKKAEREEQKMATITKAKNQFRKELDWMRRQPKARGTKQKARQEAFYDTKKIAKQSVDTDELEIPVKMERLGTKILEMHHVGKAFGDIKILNDFSYNFKRKERVGVVGNNGTGKTTFLNMILGKESVDKGKIITGETVVFGYYDQEYLNYEDDKKVIDVIRDVAEFIPLEKGRQMSAAQFLEKFLFPRDMHYSYVRKLSGGEKRRLKLMTVLMSNPNFLILDEPTNDLDIFVMSVLEDYLRNFQGCLIVVSHDRYFMDKMVDHLFVFKGDGNVIDILGNYAAFRKLQKNNERKVNKVKTAESESISKPDKVKDKLSYKEKVEFENLEKEIEELEKEKKQLTVVLSKSDTSSDELIEAGDRLAVVVEQLEVKSDRWLELSEYC